MKYLFALLLVLAAVPANAANCWWNGYRWVCPYSGYYEPYPYQWHEPDFWRWHEHHEHHDRWEHREHR